MSQPNYPNSGDYGQQPSYSSYPASPQQGYTQQGYQYAAHPAGPPPSNAGWAVATILFFWPLAFVAFNHLHAIYPRWAMGDHQGAQEASDRVKTLGKIALGIFLGFFVCFAVLYGVLIATVLSAVGGGYR